MSRPWLVPCTSCRCRFTRSAVQRSLSTKTWALQLRSDFCGKCEGAGVVLQGWNGSRCVQACVLQSIPARILVQHLVKRLGNAAAGLDSGSIVKHGEGKMKTGPFPIEAIPLPYTRALEARKQDPAARKAYHKDSPQQGIHFCGSGAGWDVVLELFNVIGHRKGLTSFHVM